MVALVRLFAAVLGIVAYFAWPLLSLIEPTVDQLTEDYFGWLEGDGAE